MFGWIRAETAAERLERFGFDPETDWDDDPRLDKMSWFKARRIRAALRSFGRQAYNRPEVKARRKEPKGHGMGDDGRQK